jgi:hypothetical protein
VIESITDCAFSWPISGDWVSIVGFEGGWREERTLVVIYYVSKMVSTAVMSLPDTHRVVCKVDIAVVAWEGGSV